MTNPAKYKIPLVADVLEDLIASAETVDPTTMTYKMLTAHINLFDSLCAQYGLNYETEVVQALQDRLSETVPLEIIRTYNQFQRAYAKEAELHAKFGLKVVS